MKIDDDLRHTFDEEGYVVIKNFFTHDETDEIRNGVLESFNKRRINGGVYGTEKNAKGENFYGLPELLSISELDKFNFVVLHPKIIQLSQILINGPVCYFGDSTAQIGTGTRGYHKDNVDRSDSTGPDWQSNYDVLRIGIYTQDTFSHSGGLQLRLKSHLSANRFYGTPKNIRLKKGDILAWKLTMTHSGNTLLPRIYPNFSYLLPRITSKLPEYFFKPYAAERVALFMTFGNLNSIHTANYKRYLESRSDTLSFKPTELSLDTAKLRNISLLPLKN